MNQTYTTGPYPSDRTAILLVDPYNDFLSEGGKLWPRVSELATRTNLLANMHAVVRTARTASLPILYVPHHRSEPDDLAHWDHPTPYQVGSSRAQVFAKDSWGGEWHPDFLPQPGDTLIKEHWGSSGFANTDLDFQLKQKCVTHVVLIGLVANTCIESTGRFAAELGYHVTLVRDATAAFSEAALHAAHEINGPTFAHRICTTQELVAFISTGDQAHS